MGCPWWPPPRHPPELSARTLCTFPRALSSRCRTADGGGRVLKELRSASERPMIGLMTSVRHPQRRAGVQDHSRKGRAGPQYGWTWHRSRNCLRWRSSVRESVSAGGILKLTKIGRPLPKTAGSVAGEPNMLGIASRAFTLNLTMPRAPSAPTPLFHRRVNLLSRTPLRHSHSGRYSLASRLPVRIVSRSTVW